MDELPSKKTKRTPKHSANAEMSAIETEIANLVAAGKAVPRALEMKMLYCLARLEDDTKEKKDTYRQIAALRARDEKKGITVADVPKEVLTKIAEFKARGLTPYHIKME